MNSVQGVIDGLVCGAEAAAVLEAAHRQCDLMYEAYSDFQSKIRQAEVRLIYGITPTVASVVCFDSPQEHG